MGMKTRRKEIENTNPPIGVILPAATTQVGNTMYDKIKKGVKP